MMQLFKRSDKSDIPAVDPSAIILGGQAVKVRKVTIGQWRELYSVVGNLPQMLISVVTAPTDSRIPYLLAVVESAIDDVVNVVAVLTGLEPAWINENVSPDELMAYFVAVARVNDFGGLLKNVQGALKLTQTLDNAADAVMSAE
ncbi:hypothetical protein [Paenibacillus sp. FSL R7-269]|uniref:hypothetical protein n=1 Tax=Paenibacillus sp. FSL R7-269 TaxID=1226755 RepID=UPI0004AE27E4|nr:hypothetical protein [Paenibacillus sp. FSL R7-269]